VREGRLSVIGIWRRWDRLAARGCYSPDRASAAIQEQILFRPKTMAGTDPITERDLRDLTQEVDWELQLSKFRLLMNSRQPC
jgi:hypothetical protein